MLAELSARSLSEVPCEEVCQYVGEIFGPSSAVDDGEPPASPDPNGGHGGAEGAGDEPVSPRQEPKDDVEALICEGRPHGHVEPVRSDAIGAMLAYWAHLEAAAVFAFDQLARRLVVLGAPTQLIARCRTAQRDEVRHARVLGAFAQRRGHTVAPVTHGDAPSSLLELALHNAREAVHETFSALVHRWQSVNLPGAGLRTAMAAIAKDEVRHAELAWDLHAWLRGQLSSREQRQVDDLLTRTLDGLPERAAAAAEAMPEGYHPTADTSRSLAGKLAGHLLAVA